MKILLTILFCTLASSLLAKEVQKIILQATSKEEEKVTKKESPLLIGTERIRFFDGSDLRGTLLKLDQENNIFWRHESSYKPIRFRFRAIESLVLDRFSKSGGDHSGKHLVRIRMKNGDSLRCDFTSLNQENLVVATSFAKEISVPLNALLKLEFLPDTHEILYDSSEGLSDWKSSNRKSWTGEEGDLVSSYSGSTGTTLPQKDAIEVEFEAQWERSFYLALRFFSDSDGASYGNTGYHLSFSNSRLNLQVNKRIKGRVTRETIGSATIDEITRSKKARFSIYAHRKKKEFIIRVNGREVARWKDPSEDFFPDGNGILFINQGGNSFMRLKELTLAGWDGKFFPMPAKTRKNDSSEQYAVFTNGDSTEVSSISGSGKSFSLKTKRGDFQVPLSRMRSLDFQQEMTEKEETVTSEQVFLSRSLGRLSFNLESITEGQLWGVHPAFGNFSIPLDVVKRMKCNQNLKKVRIYLTQLAEVKKALNDRQPNVATTILNQTNPSFRGWYWGRLMLLAENMQSIEKLSFAPHPEKGLTSATFAGDSETILTVGKDGTYGLWNGHAKLASGKFTNGESFPIEIGRFSNEEQKVVTIARPFWLGKTEVTQEQFETLMGNNPSVRKEPNLPIEVSWNDAQAFCKKLNETQKAPPGYEWRLPTEAEWEYSCRAGTSGPFFGSEPGQLPNDEETHGKHLDKLGWFAGNSGGESQPVGQKQPNAFGLLDMHGNVWEWCLDAVKRNKTSFLTDRKTGTIDPFSREGEWRALRGGSFEVPYSRCRSAYRGANAPTVSDSGRGFRLALAPVLGLEGNSTLITGGEDREIKNLSLVLKSITQGTFLMGSPSFLTAPKAITDSFGDKLITGSSDGKLSSTDFSGRPLNTLHDFNSSITALASADSSPLVLVGCQNGSTHLYDLKEKKVLSTFRHHRFPVTSVTFDSNQSSFASSSLNGTINAYSTEDLNLAWSFSNRDHGNRSTDKIEYSKDGSLVLAYGRGGSPIVIDAESGKKVMALQNDLGNLVSTHFHPDGKSLVSLSENGLLILTEISSGIPYNLIRLNQESVRDFSFSKYSERIIVLNEEGMCSIRAFPRSGTIIVESPDKPRERTPDYFFALSRNEKFSTPNLSDFMNEKGLENDLDSPPKGCAYSPDGKWFVSSVDGALRLWRCETDSWVTTIAEKLAAPVVDCTFSPKGDYIVAKLATGHLLAYPSLLFTIDSKDGDSPRTPNTDSSSAKEYEGISFNKWFGSKTRQTD
jgi:formylglycine-generating enzyme required for sulfatase activity/WD40 repeat protein